MSLDDEVETSLYKFITKDGDVEIDFNATKLCGKVTAQIASDATATSFQLENTSLETAKIIIEYLVQHAGVAPQPIPVPLPAISGTNAADVTPDKWDGEFIDRVYSDKQLRQVHNAAIFLDCKPLTSLCSAKYALLMRGKTLEEAQAILRQ